MPFENVELMTYSRGSSTVSDHKPVYASLNVKVKRVDWASCEQTLLDVMEELCHYDGDLREAMAVRFGDRAVCGDSVDLRWAARAALVAAGVPSPRIVDVGGCTSCDADRYFSHRRDAGVTGRHAGLIWIEEQR
jgi:hypothetical protein